MRFTISAALIALAIATTNAQLPTGLISGLSTQCLGGLSTLITNTALNDCLALSTALTTFSGTSGSDNSLVPDLQPYLTNDICPRAACNTTTLTSANQTIVSACQTELNNGTTIVTPLTYLFTHYDVIREAACLKNGNNLCAVETLSAIQTTTRMNITLSYLLAFNQSTLGGIVQALAMNKTALCSDCDKALFTTLAPLVAASSVASLESTFTQQCGNGSIGTIPSDITQSANGTSTGSSSASSGSSSSSSSSSGSKDGASHAMTLSISIIAISALVSAGFALII